eukprot:TRINITY_DN6376_c0_g2_i1.p1 TRINITY_DN6376_c0_g2~~TRINITY_DN6376_c0_g2_i1.p1  ORF type:complete len:630 (+),score=153.46 TRINITY_DN6376_c0_g2_i1:137-2026(+)
MHLTVNKSKDASRTWQTPKGKDGGKLLGDHHHGPNLPETHARAHGQRTRRTAAAAAAAGSADSKVVKRSQDKSRTERLDRTALDLDLGRLSSRHHTIASPRDNEVAAAGVERAGVPQPLSFGVDATPERLEAADEDEFGYDRDVSGHAADFAPYPEDRLSVREFSLQRFPEAPDTPRGMHGADVWERLKIRNDGGPTDKPPIITQEERQRLPKVAAGKAISILMKMETVGKCEVETGSVYGAALVMPQVARSTEWSATFMALSLRAYFLLLFNVLLQGFLLSMIGIEQLMIYPFSGQMHLCDFGASIPHCNDDPTQPDCRGPAGTAFSYPRLYGYDMWKMRRFVRDGLTTLFPGLEEEIKDHADPGEYGVENQYCRIGCVLIFMMAVVDDLRATIDLAYLLYAVPTLDESWISYEVPEPIKAKIDSGELSEINDLDFVKFQVAGMPLAWKLVNFVAIWIPKFCLWLALAASGVHYLMETAGIVDMIVNAMALTFVLDIDELVFARLATGLTKHIMDRFEGKEMYDTSVEENETEEQVLQRFQREELDNRWSRFSLVLPVRLFQILASQVFFMGWYYLKNCVPGENGGSVSKPMRLPSDLRYSPLSLMFGFEPASEDEPFWSMPSQATYS